MKYDLADLRLFVAVAEQGSVSKGAAIIHRSAPAASYRLQQLEQNFGTPLLERHNQRMALTAAGEALLRQARQVLAETEALNAELGAYARGVHGVVRLHANTNATNVFLPQDLADFLALQPQVNVLLEERSSPDIVLAIATGAADIGIVAGELVAEAGLQSQHYRSDRLVLVVPPQHALVASSQQDGVADGVAFAAALDEPFVSLASDSAIHAFLLSQARMAGKTLQLRIQVRSFDAVCHMVAAGVGVGLVPASAVQLNPYPLVSLPLSDAWASRELKVIHRAQPTPNRHVQALLSHLARQSSATAG